MYKTYFVYKLIMLISKKNIVIKLCLSFNMKKKNLDSVLFTFKIV